MINRVYIILASLFLISCIEFRISDEEAIKKLGEKGTSIQFADLTVGERNMHYAYTDNQKEILVVFVHGSPGSWNAFIDFFKADSILNEMDMLSVDRPGFGASGFGIVEPNLEMQAHQIKRVTDQFNHRFKILVGHSLGGPVIARMAMDYPDSFDALIMVAPSIDPELEKTVWYQRAINSKVGSALTPEEFEVSNDEILPLKEELGKMMPLWKEIRVPTIVIQGTSDRLVPKENADFAMRMISDTLLEVWMLEDVNHFIPWSHPDEIIKAIQHISDGFR